MNTTDDAENSRYDVANVGDDGVVTDQTTTNPIEGGLTTLQSPLGGKVKAGGEEESDE